MWLKFSNSLNHKKKKKKKTNSLKSLTYVVILGLLVSNFVATQYIFDARVFLIRKLCFWIVGVFGEEDE